MTYLTKISFTYFPRFLQSKKSLNNEHKFVLSLFPDNIDSISPRQKLNILYLKQEYKNKLPIYLIQSDIEPSLENIKSEETRKNIQIETKIVTPIYEKIIEAKKISYKITLSPSKRKGNKTIPITDEIEILNWWNEVANHRGLSIEKNQTIIQRMPIKEKENNVLNTVSIVGRGTINNKAFFSKYLREGFGRNKNYGYGLLLIGNP